jgi:hypothetical protein
LKRPLSQHHEICGAESAACFGQQHLATEQESSLESQVDGDPAASGLSSNGASTILVPRVSDTMASARILRWLKSPGDSVKSGEELVELETDKVTVFRLG